MNNTLPKRGRPPKESARLKADYLDIRLLAIEKQAFRDAADLAGLDLSAWVRERLRMSARKELEAAGQAVAFLGKPHGIPLDYITEAHYKHRLSCICDLGTDLREPGLLASSALTCRT